MLPSVFPCLLQKLRAYDFQCGSVGNGGNREASGMVETGAPEESSAFVLLQPSVRDKENIGSIFDLQRLFLED